MVGGEFFRDEPVYISKIRAEVYLLVRVLPDDRKSSGYRYLVKKKLFERNAILMDIHKG